MATHHLHIESTSRFLWPSSETISPVEKASTPFEKKRYVDQLKETKTEVDSALNAAIRDFEDSKDKAGSIDDIAEAVRMMPPPKPRSKVKFQPLSM